MTARLLLLLLLLLLLVNGSRRAAVALKSVPVNMHSQPYLGFAVWCLGELAIQLVRGDCCMPTAAMARSVGLAWLARRIQNCSIATVRPAAGAAASS
jgi:hypothetical protein